MKHVEHLTHASDVAWRVGCESWRTGIGSRGKSGAKKMWEKYTIFGVKLFAILGNTFDCNLYIPDAIIQIGCSVL